MLLETWESTSPDLEHRIVFRELMPNLEQHVTHLCENAHRDVWTVAPILASCPQPLAQTLGYRPATYALLVFTGVLERNQVLQGNFRTPCVVAMGLSKVRGDGGFVRESFQGKIRGTCQCLIFHRVEC